MLTGGARHRQCFLRVKPVTIFAPAKLNLFLAVTGRRADGFHELVSVAAPLDFGDTLVVEARGEGQGPNGNFSLTCNDEAVPCDESNLVLKAARAFAIATGCRGGANFSLEKQIPMGAGLGGGSSDAVAALQAMNTLAGKPLAAPALMEIATRLGSDCALFLHDGPVVMRGRGDRVASLPVTAAARLRGRRVLIFKPGFAIPTAWAYAQMAARPETYVPAHEAEARLAAWCEGKCATAEGVLFNNMERVVVAKFLALPVLLAELAARFGLAPRMSGSGSACFALLPDEAPVPAISAAVRAAWGASAFVVEAHLV
jgi:4-diphosphocytidyl-2-C-methyl-D-erythritol kinase